MTITPDRAAAVCGSGRGATSGPTGVEMEAMTAAGMAALTVYDMIKAVDRDMEIGRRALEDRRQERRVARPARARSPRRP